MRSKVTTNGRKGGNLVGKPHNDSKGNSVGGIKAVVTDANDRPVELEGGEVIINKVASRKHWKELSRINQSAGDGVPIGPPTSNDEDPEEYKDGGKIIEFNVNHVPNKWIMNYAKELKANNPEVWKKGGNIFGNEAFENLKRVSDRGYWLDSEKWMYIKWRSYVARHKKDFRIEGVVAMLKWVDKVDKGWVYMKQIIESEIKKKSVKSGWKTKKTTRMSKDNSKYSKGGPIPSEEKPRTTYDAYQVGDTGIWKGRVDSVVKIQRITGSNFFFYDFNTNTIRSAKHKDFYRLFRREKIDGLPDYVSKYEKEKEDDRKSIVSKTETGKSPKKSDKKQDEEQRSVKATTKKPKEKFNPDLDYSKICQNYLESSDTETIKISNDAIVKETLNMYAETLSEIETYKGVEEIYDEINNYTK